MEAQELREMTDQDLLEQIEGLKESVFRLRFKLSLGEIGALNNYRQARKDLARIRTILRERELNLK